MAHCWIRLLALAFIANLPALPGWAAERDYDACVAQTAEAPAAALESARRWRLETGDLAARHCQSLALVALERYGEAAAELTELAAASTDAPGDHQAALFSQAGHAWLLAEQFDLAESAFDRALELRPGNADLLIDRAQARTARARHWDALDDLNRALAVAPRRADALVFRAAIYRRLGSHDLATVDVARALSIEPENADALVERGILLLAADKVAAARSDFGRVLVTAPGSEAAEVAQEFLAELDRDEQ